MKRKKKSVWSGGTITINVGMRRYGGPGYDMIGTLRARGIPARKARSWCGSTSSYMGCVGIDVPFRFRDRARKIAFGRGSRGVA
jgi:hypothetical protein